MQFEKKIFFKVWTVLVYKKLKPFAISKEFVDSTLLQYLYIIYPFS